MHKNVSPRKSSILYTDACSVRNKWAEQITKAEEFVAEFMAVTETWLSVDDHISLAVQLHYLFYRQDRNDNVTCSGVASIKERLVHRKPEIRICTLSI